MRERGTREEQEIAGRVGLREQGDDRDGDGVGEGNRRDHEHGATGTRDPQGKRNGQHLQNDDDRPLPLLRRRRRGDVGDQQQCEDRAVAVR